MLALVVLGYPLVRDVGPSPQGAWLSVVCLGWLLAPVVLLVATPEIARPAGKRLTFEEGLCRRRRDKRE